MGVLKFPRLLILVRLDAADVMHVGLVERAHQQDKGGLEDRSLCRLSVRALLRRRDDTASVVLTRLPRHRIHPRRHRPILQHLSQKPIRRLRQQRQMLLWHNPAVLLQESVHRIRHIPRIMHDLERRIPVQVVFKHGLVRRRLELAVQLVDEGRVGAGGEARLLVEEGDDADLALDEGDAGLVVGELDGVPGDSLFDVLGLVELEDVREELLLQLLVRVVDAELLKGVLSAGQ